MNLVSLKYLVSLAREKHFGHAAQACGVSQPTLSIAVKNLEAELGVQLFERTPQDIRPTPIGLSIVSHAMVVLQEMQAMEEMAQQSHAPDKGVFRLGGVHHLSPRCQAVLTQQFRTSAPQTPVFWHLDARAKLTELLKEGALDAVILDCPIDVAGLKTAPLLQETLFVALATEHPLAKSKRLELKALEHETLLLPGHGDNHLEPLSQSCPELARWLNVPTCMVQKVKGASLDAIAHMVVAGLGISILPRMSDAQDLCYLNLKGIKLCRQWVWASRAHHHRETSAALLQNVVSEMMRDALLPSGVHKSE